MLRCYPIEATQENWVHETLISTLKLVHEKLDAGEVIDNTPEAWEGLLPVELGEDKKSAIMKSRGIRDRVFRYKTELDTLLPLERRQVIDALESQNKIVELISGHENIVSIEDTFPKLNEKVKDLFVFSYGKLTDFKVREHQYRIVFHDLADKICPFCGIERVMNPDETAQDQDHYLAKSIYPFAAVNMRNLVPMCRCCNRDYKKDADVLRCEMGRRKAFDPYNCNPPSISLVNSQLDEQNDSPQPTWDVQFIPETEEARTWDDVFKIRTRYKRDILNQYFDRWLRDFAGKCYSDRRRGIIDEESSDQDVRQVLAYYMEDKKENPSIGVGFLEPMVFDFLLGEFDKNNNRIIELIRDAVLGVRLEDVA